MKYIDEYWRNQVKVFYQMDRSKKEQIKQRSTREMRYKEEMVQIYKRAMQKRKKKKQPPN